MLNLRNKLFGIPASEKKILLYGLQRSGTNYLETLIKLNYPGCVFLNGEKRNEITHKHYRLYDNKLVIPEPQFTNNNTYPDFEHFESALPKNMVPDLYILISKDPYSWFGSYVNWSKKNNWVKPNYHYIEEYNLFYRKWMTFAEQTDKVIFIRYADLLTDPLGTLNKIGTALHLAPKHKLKTTKKVYASKRFTGNKKERFLNKDYMKSIAPEDLQAIQLKIDRELMKFLGYQENEE